MSATSYPADATPVSADGAPGVTPAKRKRARPWVGSFTFICFIFGGLVATQFRAYDRLNERRADLASQQAEAADLILQAQKGKAATEELKARIEAMTKQIEGSVSREEMKKLTGQLHELQLIAGITKVVGEGVRIDLADNPNAAKIGGGGGFLPGIVHDFDLLQVVNELRATGAEAISVNGIRITGYTPIRCVGPVININGQPQAPPFKIEAVGNPERLMTGMEMAGGILRTLEEQQALGVQRKIVRFLELEASETTPKMQAAKIPAEPKGKGAGKTTSMGAN